MGRKPKKKIQPRPEPIDLDPNWEPPTDVVDEEDVGPARAKQQNAAKPTPRLSWSEAMETLVLNLVSTSVLDTSCPELSIPLMVTALREINRVIVSEQQVEDFLRNRHIPKQFTSANRAKVHTIVTRALVELKLKEHRDEVCNELVALKSREPDKVSAFLIRANAESAAKCSTADTHLKKALQKGFLSPSKGPVCNSENMLNLAATAAPTAASSSGLVSQSLINPLAMDNVINLPNGSVKAGVGHLSTFASYWYACTRGEKPFLVLIFWCPLGSEVAVNFLPSEASDKTTIVATWTFPAFHDLCCQVLPEFPEVYCLQVSISVETPPSSSSRLKLPCLPFPWSNRYGKLLANQLLRAHAPPLPRELFTTACSSMLANWALLYIYHSSLSLLSM